MALTPQEFALLKTRLGGASTPISAPTSNTMDRVGDVIKTAGNDVLSAIGGTDKYAGETPVRRGFEATASAFNAVPQVAVAASPEVVRQGVAVASDVVGGMFSKLTETLGSAQIAQDFVMQHPKAAKALEELLGTTSAAGIITGNILGAKGGASGVSKGAEVAQNTGGKAVSLAKDTAMLPVKKIADVLTPIDLGTENVLNPTRLIPKENIKNIPMENLVAQAVDKSAKLDEYVKVSEKAKADYSQPTALARAGDKATEAANVLQNKLTKQAQLKNEALGATGDKTVGTLPQIRRNMRDLLRDRVGVNLIIKDGKLNIENASGRQSKVAFDVADNKLMSDSYRVLARLGKSPTVRQIDDTVDALQDLLYKRKGLTAVPVNGQVESVLKNVTGQLNKEVKKVAGEQYSKANAKYAYFVDTFDKLNKTLGDKGVRGASLMKQLFGPAGEAPRRLFKDIKDLTGIDLVEEATLAKFAMESVGDARQASLLEEIINSGAVTPKSFIAEAARALVKKTQNPVNKAKKIINENR